ncbi:hypothetical protein BD309DRAFT_493681 [Dichomitus squalens]|nr:hypothetical protein BD309DRAFT_493681 [Dichomitus squalens]
MLVKIPLISIHSASSCTTECRAGVPPSGTSPPTSSSRASTRSCAARLVLRACVLYSWCPDYYHLPGGTALYGSEPPS